MVSSYCRNVTSFQCSAPHNFSQTQHRDGDVTIVDPNLPAGVRRPRVTSSGSCAYSISKSSFNRSHACVPPSLSTYVLSTVATVTQSESSSSLSTPPTTRLRIPIMILRSPFRLPAKPCYRAQQTAPAALKQAIQTQPRRGVRSGVYGLVTASPSLRSPRYRRWWRGKGTRTRNTSPVHAARSCARCSSTCARIKATRPSASTRLILMRREGAGGTCMAEGSDAVRVADKGVDS